MSRLILAGVATGFSGIVAIAGTLMITDPFGAHGAADRGAVVARPDVPVTATSAPPRSPTARPSAPPSSASPTRKAPARTAPTRTAPTRTAPPTRAAERPVDAAAAAAIVRKKFTGARIVETEREDDGWELTFYLRGVENEIHVDPATGKLSEHEVEDD